MPILQRSQYRSPNPLVLSNEQLLSFSKLQMSWLIDICLYPLLLPNVKENLEDSCNLWESHGKHSVDFAILLVPASPLWPLGLSLCSWLLVCLSCPGRCHFHLRLLHHQERDPEQGQLWCNLLLAHCQASKLRHASERPGPILMLLSPPRKRVVGARWNWSVVTQWIIHALIIQYSFYGLGSICGLLAR